MSEGRISIIDGSPAEDESAWLDVVNAKLDGVGFHTAMYSQCLGGGLYDMAKIHKYRAVVRRGGVRETVRPSAETGDERPGRAVKDRV